MTPTGDGTTEAPFRTLTKALSAARTQDARRIQLEYGTYEEGEAFPLSLPAGLEIRGIGSGGTVLRAEAGTIFAVDTGRIRLKRWSWASSPSPAPTWDSRFPRRAWSCAA